MGYVAEAWSKEGLRGEPPEMTQKVVDTKLIDEFRTDMGPVLEDMSIDQRRYVLQLAQGQANQNPE
eukprot:304432-Amphidinium_carterae.1